MRTPHAIVNVAGAPRVTENERAVPASSPCRALWSSGGFSIIELMMVVVIIAVLTIVAFATFGGQREERDLRRATVEVASLLQEIRGHATSTGRAMVVQIDESDLGSGSGPGLISWWESLDNTCGSIPPNVTGSYVLDYNDLSTGTGRATITRVEPKTSGFGASVRMCITPSGRVVDPLTMRPVPAVGGATYDGQLFIELNLVRCRTGGCETSPFFTTVTLGFTGLTSSLPPGSRIADGSTP